MRQLSLYAVTAPGIEGITAEELGTVGVDRPSTEPGGVSFAGSLMTIYRANLHSRTASRIIARIGEFSALTFAELVRRATVQPWEDFLHPAKPLRLRVTCRKSRLYHSDAVAERVAEAIDKRLGGASDVSAAGGEDSETEGEAQLVIVRMLHDRCLLSVDTSGALLHRRGYRQALAKAPLRETLAAAMLLAARWDGRSPLVDPMCGAGTIPIEAALIARGIAPGLMRSEGGFAFMRWPGFDGELWGRLVDEARVGIRPSAPAPIVGSDRDAGAIEIAAANAARAGVAADIQLVRRTVSALELPAERGLVATNPPYGVRVGERGKLRDLYAAFGRVLRERGAGWGVVMISADRALEGQTGLGFETILRTRNGGIPVRVLRAEVR